MKHDLDDDPFWTPFAWPERADNPTTWNGLDLLPWRTRRRPRPTAQPIRLPWRTLTA